MNHLDSLPYFLSVVKHKSFAAAARELGVSRSAVNKRVIQLEEGLGVRLLHRTTRQVSLTESGERFFQYATQAFHWLEKAEDAATSQQEQVIGTIKVNVPASFGRLIINPLLPQFLQNFPGVQIDMTMTDDYVDIVAGGYDVVIRGGDLEDSSMIARKLITSRSIICASKAYFSSSNLPMPTTPTELRQHNALIYQHTVANSEWIFAHNNSIESIIVQGNYRVNNSEALLEATKQGLGITRLPDFIAKEEVKSGELIQLLPDYLMPEKSIYALYPEREHIPAKLRVFLDYITRQLAS